MFCIIVGSMSTLYVRMKYAAAADMITTMDSTGFTVHLKQPNDNRMKCSAASATKQQTVNSQVLGSEIYRRGSPQCPPTRPTTNRHWR